MKTLAVIPARWASSRLPGKPLCDLGGRPVIYWAWRRALAVRGVDEVIIATDDRRIADVARDFGASVAMTDVDCPNGTVRARQALRDRSCDYVLNLQGDEPLLNPIHAEMVLRVLIESGAPMATLVAPATTEQKSDPNCVKVALRLDGRALYFSRSPLPYERNPAERVWRHLGLYGYRRDFLERYSVLESTPLSEAESLEQLRALEQGYDIVCARLDVAVAAPGIDTPRDLEHARELVDRLGLKPDVVV